MPSDGKPVIAFFHKVYYKVIEIPYGPLGSIKNAIRSPRAEGEEQCIP